MSTVLNGKPRKQLSDQLDRMDQIIDVLGDGLVGAVSEAMKAGTTIAVKQALVEVLSNQEFLAAIRTGLAEPPTPIRTAVAGRAGDPGQGLVSAKEIVSAKGIVSEQELVPERKKPSLWSRLKAKVKSLKDGSLGILSQIGSRVIRTMSSLRERTVSMAKAVRRHFVTAKQTLIENAGWIRFASRVRLVLLLCVGIGTATGTMSLLAPHALAAIVSGASAAIMVVAVQLGLKGLWLIRRLRPNAI